MKKIISFLFFIITFFNVNYVFSAPISLMDDAKGPVKSVIEPKNTLYIELKDGIVIAELFPKVAPLHVQRIRTLAADGFYDNVKFHRVISGFMAQTGDPTGTGRGGSKLGRLYAEFNNEHHTRGTLSMARASDVNSANSQFFIVTGEFFPELDNQYTIFGRVIEGMDYIDKIKAGDSSKNGMVDKPDVMIKVVTGEMLNNKSLATVKEEIKVINDLQNEKLKSDPNYKKKSVLEILLQTKDIDINKVEENKEVTPAVQNTNNGVTNPAENKNNSAVTNGTKSTDKIDESKSNTQQTPAHNNTAPSNLTQNANSNTNGTETKIVTPTNTNNTNTNNTNTNDKMKDNNTNQNMNPENDNFSDDTIPTPYEGNIE